MNKYLFRLSGLFFWLCLLVWATDHDISKSSLVITDNGEYVVYGTSSNNTVTVRSGNPKITLSDVSIFAFGEGVYALDLQRGRSRIVLKGDNVLQSEKGPAMHVAPSSGASIDGEGTLNAVARDGAGAGIGGASRERSGMIVIEGGLILAHGAPYAAGIGGGANGAANVTINGGEILANAGWCGAGIGGGTGFGGQAGTITINGGFVRAYSENGAGIGCGDEGGHNVYPAGTVTINGGTVRATSISGAGIGAGCGSGDSGRGPNIYIGGGAIWAHSKNGSPLGQGAGKGECPAPLTTKGGEAVYRATLAEAVIDHSYDWNFSLEKDGLGYGYAYAGPGFASGNDLYFYLPNGHYEVESENVRYEGAIENGEAVFNQVPEPVGGFFAMVGFWLARIFGCNQG